MDALALPLHRSRTTAIFRVHVTTYLHADFSLSILTYVIGNCVNKWTYHKYSCICWPSHILNRRAFIYCIRFANWSKHIFDEPHRATTTRKILIHAIFISKLHTFGSPPISNQNRGNQLNISFNAPKVSQSKPSCKRDFAGAAGAQKSKNFHFINFVPAESSTKPQQHYLCTWIEKWRRKPITPVN